VGVPSHFDVDATLHGSLGSVGPVTVGGSLSSIGPVGPVSIAGIPDTFHINIDHIPKIQIGVDPVTLHLDPVEFSLSIKEIPSVRGHLPADFSVGLSLLGMELLCVRLCGEAQIITEPYRPDPCERCGGPNVRLITSEGTVGVVNDVPNPNAAGGGK
jgi:hypothetical protein